MTTFISGKIRKNSKKIISNLLSLATEIKLETHSMDLDDYHRSNGYVIKSKEEVNPFSIKFVTVKMAESRIIDSLKSKTRSIEDFEKHGNASEIACNILENERYSKAS